MSRYLALMRNDCDHCIGKAYHRGRVGDLKHWRGIDQDVVVLRLQFSEQGTNRLGIEKVGGCDFESAPCQDIDLMAVPLGDWD